MASNIDTTLELNKLLQQQNQLYLTQAKMMRGQTVMLKQMLDMFKQLDPRQLTEGWNELGESMQGAEEAIQNVSSSGQESLGSLNSLIKAGAGSMTKMGGNLKGLGKGLVALSGPVGVIATLGGGLETAMSAAEGLFNVMTSVASAISNVAIAIITAPFKMLQTLINGIGAGSTELAQALEAIRKQFGDLHTGASKAIIDISRGMKGQLAETGLRVYRIFGNLAERLRTITQYAEQLGPLFNNLAQGLVANAEAFGAYVKGLGLTEEGMKGVGRLALSTGQDFTEVGRQITTMAFQMGEAFGINGTQISRAVGDMLNDVRNFGSLSIKQLTQVAVFANRLGLEFRDLQGTIDQFDNFEQAAESAAQLSQAFGLNVDALQLIQEQDPAARFEQLRKAFFQTGRSVEQMTRQELRLLAAQTGLSEEAVKLGFSLENQGVNYADVQKQAELTQKKQLSQAEAMVKLSNSIERLVKSGDIGQGGFFDRFIQGFLRGITLSQDFRKMMMTLRGALRATFQAGRELGQVFVRVFPGVRDVFGGITEFFDRTRWRKMLSEVVKAFSEFFKTVLDNPTAGLKTLFSKLQDAFFNNFDSKKQAGRRILEGIGTFYKALFNISVSLIQIGLEQIGQSFRNFFRPGTLENDALKWIGSLIKSVWDYIRTFDFVGAFTNIVTAARSSFDLVVETMRETVIPGILDAFNDIDFDAISNSFSSVLIPSIMNGFVSIRGAIFDFIAELPFEQIIGGIRRVATGILGIALSSFTTIGENLAPFLESIFGQLINFVKSIPWPTVISGLLTTIYDLGTDVFLFLYGRLPSMLLRFLSEAVQGIVRLVPALLQGASALVSGMLKGISGFFSDFGPILKEKLIEAIPEILDGFYRLVVDGYEFLQDELPRILIETAVSLVQAIIYAFNEVPHLIIGAFELIGNAISGVFEGITTWIKTTFPEAYATIEPLINVLRGIGVVVGRAMSAARKSITDFVQNTVVPFVDGVRASFTEMWNSFKTSAEPILTFVSTKLSEFRDYVGGIIESIGGIATTISTALGIETEGPGILDSVIEQTRQGFADLERIGRESATSVQASATQAATASAQAASSGVTAQGTGAGTDSSFAGLFGSTEAARRRDALEEINNIRIPSPSRVARLERDIQTVTDRYTNGIVNNVRDLVAAVNTVTTDLESIGDGPQRINVQLKQLANHLGVGGTQRLEIKNRNFTIQLNVNVVLDADEFEQALTSRPGGSTFVIRSEE